MDTYKCSRCGFNTPIEQQRVIDNFCEHCREIEAIEYNRQTDRINERTRLEDKIVKYILIFVAIYIVMQILF